MEGLPVRPKNVLITGCSSGIGRASAVYLAQNGFTVYATVRKQKDADSLNALQLDNLVPLCPLDLTHLQDIPAILQNVQADMLKRNGQGLFALINNAGGGQVAPIELIDLQQYQTELQARLVGSAALLQAFLPLIRQAGGRILWITTPATIPTPYVTSIHACDFAVNCMARTLDIELKPWHIPNIQIRCGGIKTAKGLETQDEVNQILQHSRANLYSASLSRWSSEMADFDAQRTPPEQVARVIYKALLTNHPHSRYSVGHMAGLAKILEALPQPLADSILKARF